MNINNIYLLFIKRIIIKNGSIPILKSQKRRRKNRMMNIKIILCHRLHPLPNIIQ